MPYVYVPNDFAIGLLYNFNFQLCQDNNGTYTKLANAKDSSFLSSQNGEQYLIMRKNDT